MANEKLEELKAFIATIFQPDDLVEIRSLDPVKGGLLPSLSNFMPAREVALSYEIMNVDNKRGYNIFFGANPRKEVASGNKKNIALARCLFADFDNIDAERIPGIIEKCGMPPASIVLTSGHGGHAYWKLAEPITNMDLWTSIQKRLIRTVKSDKAIHDSPRLLRLPGFMNRKLPIAPCETLRRSNTIYHFNKLIETMAPEDISPPDPEITQVGVPSGPKARHNMNKRAQAYINAIPSNTEGNRNKNTFIVATNLVVDFCMEESEAWIMLSAWNIGKNMPPLPETELKTVFLSALRNGQHQAGKKLTDQPANQPTGNGKGQKLDNPRRGINFVKSKDPLEVSLHFLNAKYTSMKYHRTLRKYANRWWQYVDTHYEEITEDHLNAKVYNHINKLWYPNGNYNSGDQKGEIKSAKIIATSQSVNEVKRAAVAHGVLVDMNTAPPFWVNEHPENPMDLINVQNGILYLPEKRLIPQTEEFFAINCLPYSFLPDAKCPKWIEFLLDVFNGDEESMEALQQWFGYCLTWDTYLHKIMLILGPRRCGKGTIGRILGGIVGKTNFCAPVLESLSSRFGLEQLIEKQLMLVGDCRIDNSKSKTAIMERLLTISGEDEVAIEKKFVGGSKTMRLPTKITLLSNDIPSLADSSGAMHNRFAVIQMVNSYEGRENIHLSNDLTSELSGILNWAIDGWATLKKQGYITRPRMSQAAINDMKEIGSPIAAFILDCCNTGADLMVPRAELYHAWKFWCKYEQGKSRPGTANTFNLMLRSAIPAIRMTRAMMNDGTRSRIFDGITLTVEYTGRIEASYKARKYGNIDDDEDFDRF